MPSPSIAENRPLEILLAEDDDILRETMSEGLEEAGHSVRAASDGAAALALARSRHFDVVVTDVQMPKMDGLELFEHLRREMPDLEVVIITSHGDISQAVNAMKKGAHDYVSKPFQVEELLMRLGRLGAELGLRRELEQARATLSNLDPSAVLLGQSPSMRRLLGIVETVSRTAAATLVTGESGTGKELVARMLHDLGPRRDGPFVVLNCGALTETLIEAELFGHERGAFTGAERKREGRFKAADGGTLFLDEIAELPAPAQAKLLRVLQEGSYEPIGSDTTVKVDVRVISATHRNLRERIREGLFREDLFYRVNVIEIAVPPLRDRGGDLALLVQHFLRRFAPAGRTPGISPEAWAALSGHAWPGNVRELSHAVQHAVVMSGGNEIGLEHLPNGLSPPLPEDRRSAIPVVEVVGATTIHPLGQAVRAFEREYLTRVLTQARASKAQKVQIAEALGISRKTLWEKVRTYGIETPAEPDDA